MTYPRPAGASASDFAEARIWEEEVAGLYPAESVVTRFDSVDDIDIWFPGVYLELKEKKQRYGNRWVREGGPREPDMFILDELTVRRAAEKYPAVFFLLRDRPMNRLFFAPIWELLSVQRIRLNRLTGKVAKGKWIIDVTHFRQIESPAEAHRLAVEELAKQLWRSSECLSFKGVDSV